MSIRYWKVLISTICREIYAPAWHHICTWWWNKKEEHREYNYFPICFCLLSVIITCTLQRMTKGQCYTSNKLTASQSIIVGLSLVTLGMQHCVSDMRLLRMVRKTSGDPWLYRQSVYRTTEALDRGGITEPAGVSAMLVHITYILSLKLVTRGPLTETWCGPLYKG